MCSGRCESGLALRRASAGGWGVFLRYLRSEVFHFLVPLLELLRHTERAQLLDLANHLVHYSLDLLALGGRNPFQAHALLFDAHVLEHPLQHLEAAEHLVVAFRVMAIPGMAAADEHAVSAAGQRIQDELRINPPGAHEPDDADVGGVLQPRYAGEVRCRIDAPVAEEGNDAGFPFFTHKPRLL